MKAIFYFALIFISLFSTPLPAVSQNILNQRLSKARPGDFFVAEADRMISVLAVRSVTDHSIILEEITAPSSALTPLPSSWKEWLKKRAPGHTSWSMLEIDLKEHQLLECYSFTRATWLHLSSHNSFIPTLLGLSLHPVPKEELKRIGPAPIDGEPDLRQIWKPPLIVHGKTLSDTQFSVYRAEWPQDNSQLSGNNVSLYFDQKGRTPFPVWIQIDTTHASASLRILDTGHNLPVLHRRLPRRVPEFVGIPKRTQKGMRLSVKSPKYYRSFDLFAVDVTTREKQILPITHSLVSGEGDVLEIEINREELHNILQPDHRYTWLIVPTGHSEFYSESPKAFLWKAD